MKRLSILLVLLAVISMSMAQTAQPPSPQTTPQPTPAQATAGADVYHVHFNKASLGQAVALGQSLSKPDPKAPMPGHFIVLRHQTGDDWDYCVIEHLGTKATVDASPQPPSPVTRELSSWHGDSFMSGPPWAEFARAMGIGDTKAPSPVYVVAVWRAAPGHRDQLQRSLSQPDPTQKVQVGRVVLQHLEGAPWQFMAIERYNSWQDYATNQAASVQQTGTGSDPWSEIRQHSTFHHDTITDRIAPK